MSIDKVFKWAGRKSVAPTDVTVVKKVGDLIKVSVDITNMMESNYVGFRLNYPATIMSPVFENGSDVIVKCDNGDVFKDQEIDLICNGIRDDQTGEKWIYVSKVLKGGDPVATPSGRILSMYFVCVGSGTGTLEVVEREYGHLEANTEYESEATPLTLTIQTTTEIVVAKFHIVIE